MAAMLNLTMEKKTTQNVEYHPSSIIPFDGLGLWYLMPFSTIFQLYHGGKFHLIQWFLIKD
jgi:hypothetical protein